MQLSDSADSGNHARFINHACGEGASLEIYRMYGAERNPNRPRIVLFARRDIKIGQELTFDYKFVFTEELDEDEDELLGTIEVQAEKVENTSFHTQLTFNFSVVSIAYAWADIARQDKNGKRSENWINPPHCQRKAEFTKLVRVLSCLKLYWTWVTTVEKTSKVKTSKKHLNHKHLHNTIILTAQLHISRIWSCHVLQGKSILPRERS